MFGVGLKLRRPHGEGQMGMEDKGPVRFETVPVESVDVEMKDGGRKENRNEDGDQRDCNSGFHARNYRQGHTLCQRIFLELPAILTIKTVRVETEMPPKI